MKKLKNIIILARPHQYVKNLFIFLPLFFVGQMNNIDAGEINSANLLKNRWPYIGNGDINIPSYIVPFKKIKIN